MARRRGGAVLLCAMALALCAGCLPASGGPPRVAIIGDSITAWGESELYDALNPTFQVSISANPGEFIGTMFATADLYALAPPTFVIVNLGTNDAAWRSSAMNQDFDKMAA